jgi:hypothetical protein
MTQKISTTKASLEVLNWEQASKDVAKINPEFANIINSISPDKTYKLYKCRYAYGTEIIKEGVLQLPTDKGETLPITAPQTPSSLKKDLGYNLNTNPVSIVLKNSVEIFLSHQNHTLSLYGLVKPGNIFSTWKVLSGDLESHGPAFLWDMTAGARSLFMLSKISNEGGYNRLRKKFDLHAEKPKLLIDHWHTFREIAQHADFPQPWETEILFFGEKWFKHLDDPAFIKLQQYLYKAAWRSSDYLRNQFIWNFIYSTIQRKKNIKTDPYIAETVKHLFSMATGASAGFAPAIDNIAGPIDALREIYNDIYRLKEYQPVFMQPYILGQDASHRPAYYSLEYPSTMEFSSRNRDDKNKIQDLILIKSLVNKYLNELSENHLNVRSTPIGRLSQNTDFTFFHPTEGYHAIEDSRLLLEQDHSFQAGLTADNRSLPVNSTFLRGCIRISKK